MIKRNMIYTQTHIKGQQLRKFARGEQAGGGRGGRGEGGGRGGRGRGRFDRKSQQT
jgi:hypothetical protein